jgi:type VII secretion integral membrane protein EccD
LVSAALIVVLVFAPRVGIRFARIRGPQLPRTADELQYDIEAMPADRMVRLTGYADGYLTIISVAAAVVLAGSSPFLAMTGGFGVTLGALVMAAVLLRSRALNSGWQRVPLAGAGVVVAMELVVGLDDWLEPRLRAFVVVGVAVLFFLLVLAMLRPPPRRLLPIWGHLANWAETLSAVAVIPVLLQLFGIYGWAAGLAG